VILPTAFDDCKRVNAYVPDNENGVSTMKLDIFSLFSYFVLEKRNLFAFMYNSCSLLCANHN
jgi:hypothetical protein